MGIFWNAAEGRLRAGWRLLLHAVVTTVLAAVPIALVAEPLTRLHRSGIFLSGWDKISYDRAINMMIGPMLTLAIAAGVVFAAHVFDHRKGVADFGLVRDRRSVSAGLAGFALGALLMSVIFGVRVTGGAISFAIVKAICVGTYEELVARGYQLRNLTEGLNRPAAVAITSALFALLHATTPNASVVSTAVVFATGVLFAMVRIVFDRLTASIGLHVAWNLFEHPLGS